MTRPAFVNELPPRRMTDWRTMVAFLATEPGRWALCRTYRDSRGAHSSKDRLRKDYPECEWEVRGCDVYGRFKVVRP